MRGQPTGKLDPGQGTASPPGWYCSTAPPSSCRKQPPRGWEVQRSSGPGQRVAAAREAVPAASSMISCRGQWGRRENGSRHC